MTRKIVDLIQPTSLVYIAVDGSVPMGKCKQQRYRRFKSVQETRELNQIARDYNQPLDTNQFDSNAISPGTEFMQQLADALREAFQHDHRFVIDDSLNPGEGERKIMNHIKQTSNGLSGSAQSQPSAERIVIYGLDADLIFLSLGLHHPAIYLIRENTFHQEVENQVPEYLFVDINHLSLHLVEMVTQAEPIYWKLAETELSRTAVGNCDPVRIIDDYIVISFFLGNDFVQRLYCLEIRNHGCEIILEIYRYCLRQQQHYLVEILPPDANRLHPTVELNPTFLQLFFDQLLSHEREFFDHPPKFFQSAANRELTAYQRAVKSYQTVPEYLYRLPVDYPAQVDQDYYQVLFDQTDYQLSTFNGKKSSQPPKLSLKVILRQYYQSLIWTCHYYLADCLDYHYFYPFNYAPLVLHLAQTVDYLAKRSVKSGFDCQSRPIDPIRQLMIILPPESYNLIPKQFHRILKLPMFKPYFPTHFSQTYYGNTHLHQCAPRIPVLGERALPFFPIEITPSS